MKIVKIFGGKGGCNLGYAKKLWSGMLYSFEDKKYGAKSFAYLFEYPKPMTDWGRYAKKSACTQIALVMPNPSFCIVYLTVGAVEVKN